MQCAVCLKSEGILIHTLNLEYPHYDFMYVIQNLRKEAFFMRILMICDDPLGHKLTSPRRNCECC